MIGLQSGMPLNPMTEPEQASDRQVLIVEDGLLMQKFLLEALRKHNIDCLQPVSTGAGALEQIRTRQPAAVILDIQLEGDLTGIDVVKRLPRTCPSLIIFFTGQTDTELIRQAQVTHPVAILKKPLSEPELLTGYVKAAFRYRECLRVKPSSRGEEDSVICLCAWCRRIRQLDQTWDTMSAYFIQGSVRRFTHGICPECSERQLNELRFRTKPNLIESPDTPIR